MLAKEFELLCKQLGFSPDESVIYDTEKCPRDNLTLKSKVVRCGKDGNVWICIGKLET